MLKTIYSLLLGLCLLWCANAQADYVYQLEGSSSLGTFSSPASACDVWYSKRNDGSGYWKYKGTDFVTTTQGRTNYTCNADYFGSWIQQGVVIVLGACNAPYIFNSADGSCSNPAPSQANGSKCDDQTGANGNLPMIFSAKSGGCKLLTDADPEASCAYMGSTSTGATKNSDGVPMTFVVSGQLNSAGELEAVPTFAADGFACELKSVTTSDCTLKASGGSTCQVTASYTGNVNKPPSTAPAPTADLSDLCAGKCVDTAPLTTVTDTPSPTPDNGTSETKTETTGSQSCGSSGSVNGAMVCVTNKPRSADTKVATTTTSAKNTDGSVTSTKTETTTKDVCTNVKTCSTSSSTTVSKSTTSASGSTTTTSSCSGTCNGTSSGIGTGTGSGTGTGDGEEDKDEGSASASDDCNTPPSCSGDAFSCAILRQQFLDSCAIRALPTAKQKADFQAEIDKQNAGLDANQKTMDDSVTSLVSRFESAASGSSSGGKCFEDKTFSVQGFSIVMPFSQACPYLEWFRYAVLAIAYLIALRIVSKEF